MGIFGISGLKGPVSAALAVTLTSLLAWAFASSTANIQWLGSDAVSTTVVAGSATSSHIQNA